MTGTAAKGLAAAGLSVPWPTPPAPLDPVQMPKGGLSVYGHADLNTLGIAAELSRPLTRSLSLFAEADAGYSRYGGGSWHPYAQGVAGVALHF
jgi:hypothetical protein